MTLIPCTLIIGKTTLILLHHTISLKSENAVYHTVQEITVMRNHDHNAFKPVQIILQPGYHLVIQMVGRLVQKQHITGIHQSPCQCHPFLLSPG